MNLTIDINYSQTHLSDITHTNKETLKKGFQTASMQLNFYPLFEKKFKPNTNFFFIRQLKYNCSSEWLALPFIPLILNVGDYFRADEFADQSPGNLSSSSLRRKLFLDGNGSISDSLPPASPRSPRSGAQTSLEVFYSIELSPVQCRSPVQTPSSVRSGLTVTGWLAVGILDLEVPVALKRNDSLSVGFSISCGLAQFTFCH